MTKLWSWLTSKGGKDMTVTLHAEALQYIFYLAKTLNVSPEVMAHAKQDEANFKTYIKAVMDREIEELLAKALSAGDRRMADAVLELRKQVHEKIANAG